MRRVHSERRATKSLRSVTLPLALPGMAGSMLLLFVESMVDFGNPLILSGRFNVLSVQAYLQITGNDNLPGGSALAIVLLIPSLVVYFLQNYLLERRFCQKAFCHAYRKIIRHEHRVG